MDFSFAQLLISVELQQEVSDPYALFGIRSAFMAAFRKAVCSQDGNCVSCSSSSGCAYPATFFQTIASEPAAIKRHQKPALPFVFDFPIIQPPPNRGVTLELGLTLGGSAVNHLADYLAALQLLFAEGMGRQTDWAKVLKVEVLDYSGARTVIRASQQKLALDRLVILTADGLRESRTLSSSSISLQLVTPLRILQEGKPLRVFGASYFLRSLIRRLSSLAYYYGGGELELDYKWLARQSATIAGSLDQSHWQDWGATADGRLSGVTGEVKLTGDLTDFHPFLLLGEYFHAGKGASFGLGRYRLAEEE